MTGGDTNAATARAPRQSQARTHCQRRRWFNLPFTDNSRARSKAPRGNAFSRGGGGGGRCAGGDSSLWHKAPCNGLFSCIGSHSPAGAFCRGGKARQQFPLPAQQRLLQATPPAQLCGTGSPYKAERSPSKPSRTSNAAKKLPLVEEITRGFTSLNLYPDLGEQQLAGHFPVPLLRCVPALSHQTEAVRPSLTTCCPTTRTLQRSAMKQRLTGTGASHFAAATEADDKAASSAQPPQASATWKIQCQNGSSKQLRGAVPALD